VRTTDIDKSGQAETKRPSQDERRQDTDKRRKQERRQDKTILDKTRQNLLEANIHRPKYLEDADHLAV
jgi:hypothetical protein